MFFLGQQRSSLGDIDVVKSDVHDTLGLGGYDKIKYVFKETKSIFKETFTNVKYFADSSLQGRSPRDQERCSKIYSNSVSCLQKNLWI